MSEYAGGLLWAALFRGGADQVISRFALNRL